MDQRPQFDDEFLVGISQIDDEHRRLIAIAGKVYDALDTDSATALEMAHAAVEELLDYTATHFAHEEALMAAAGYPELEAHQALHARLLRTARDMQLRVEGGEQFVPVELNQFLYNWLVGHILEQDKKFGAFAATRTAAG